MPICCICPKTVDVICYDIFHRTFAAASEGESVDVGSVCSELADVDRLGVMSRSGCDDVTEAPGDNFVWSAPVSARCPIRRQTM